MNDGGNDVMKLNGMFRFSAIDAGLSASVCTNMCLSLALHSAYVYTRTKHRDAIVGALFSVFCVPR
jgi:hypothetical protein